RVDDLERDEDLGHRAVTPGLVDGRQQRDRSFAGAVGIETLFRDRRSQLWNRRHDFPAHSPMYPFRARARSAAAVYSCVRERLNTALFGTENPDFYRDNCTAETAR